MFRLLFNGRSRKRAWNLREYEIQFQGSFVGLALKSHRKPAPVLAREGGGRTLARLVWPFEFLLVLTGGA